MFDIKSGGILIKQPYCPRCGQQMNEQTNECYTTYSVCLECLMSAQ